MTISRCLGPKKKNKNKKDVEDIEGTHETANPAKQKLQIVLSQSTIIIPLNFKRTKTNANHLDRSTISARTRRKDP